MYFPKNIGYSELICSSNNILSGIFGITYTLLHIVINIFNTSLVNIISRA